MREHRKQRRGLNYRSRRRKQHTLIITIVPAAVLGLAVLILLYGFPAPIQARLDIRPDEHAKQGTLYAASPKEMTQGEFRLMLNQLPTIEAGSRECNIQYENPVENHYSARISLYLEETGTWIGGTTRVDPGCYVEQIRLKQKLATGEYPITVRIELFEERTPAGEMAAGIILRVIESQKDQGGSQDES